MDKPPDGLEFKTLATATATTEATEPDQRGQIEALVAVTGVKDAVGDIIEPGAFRRTLGERPKPKVCLGHDWNRPVGKTLEIRELMPGDRRLPKLTAEGKPWPRAAGAVWARWQANLDSDDGRSAYSAAKFFGPEESTFSIGYRTVRARQRGSTRHIHDLDLFEYGPVLNPANRLATLQSIKADEELTSPVDSERQDFETGDDAVETKARYVHDADYWGKPVGTLITPGMKPEGGDDRKHGTSKTKESAASFFAGLPTRDQDIARAMSTDKRVEYLKLRAGGKSHDEAMAVVNPKPLPVKEPEKPEPAEEPDKPAPAKPAEAAPTKPAAPAKPKKAGKITAKQKAALFRAEPGKATVYRRDDAGKRLYNGPYNYKQGLVARIHANTAYPMERAGLVEAATDGRNYLLTEEGERLRAKLEAEDSDRQAKLSVERQAAALGPDDVAAADANVVVDAAPMDMTPAQFTDAVMTANARRLRADRVRQETDAAAAEQKAIRESEQAAIEAPREIDAAALQMRREADNEGKRLAKMELVGGGRLALVGGGNKNWTLVTARNVGVARAVDFDEWDDGAKVPKRAALQDLAGRLAAMRDKDGRPIPFTLPDTPGDVDNWSAGWRDAAGNDLGYAAAQVITGWAEENGLTYRARGRRPRPLTVPGGEPDAGGFRTRRADEVAPGDEVRLPDGSTAVVERNGSADDAAYRFTQDEQVRLGSNIQLDDGRKISVWDLAGIEKPEPVKPPPGANLSDYAVARQRGGSTSTRDLAIPVRFADDADSPAASRDPGMGALSATGGPPGRIYDPSDIARWYGRSVAENQTPYPDGTRVVFQRDSSRFDTSDDRPRVGTLLGRVEVHSGDIFQTVRLDDGTYDQYRVLGMRSPLAGTGPSGFEVDPPRERVDEVRAARGLPATDESTPLRRDQSEVESPVGDAEQPAGQQQAAEEDGPRGDLPENDRERVSEEVMDSAHVAEDTAPALPYEIVRAPTRKNLAARVRYNGREYDVAATDGVDARVTVTDDDGHTATVSGGSTTLLARDRSADRERAVREALSRVEAQHGPGEPEGEVTPAATPTPTEVGKMNAQRRSDVLRGMTDEQFDEFRAAFRPHHSAMLRSRRYGDQGERTRMARLETSVNAESLRRSSEAAGHPEFTDRAVLEQIGNETFDTTELAVTFGVKQPDMLRALRRLEGGGYVVRNSGDNSGEGVSGERRRIESLGWESSAGRDGDHGEVMSRYDADHPRSDPDPSAVRGEAEPAVETAPVDVPEGEPTPVEAEAATVEPEPAEPEPAVALAPELVDEAAALQDEVLGITEQPDGTIEVTEEVAARQDRVAALIEADDGGTLNLSSRSTPELTTTRGELSDELALQSVLAGRQAEPKPTVLRSPAGQAEKPPQRPGLAGAAEDYAEALKTGDAEMIARTKTRLQSSLRRSRVTSDTARSLADHVTGEGDDEADALLAAARGLREESRTRRNAAAKRRRQARRLERVRIQSLIDKIDAELSTRARSTEPQDRPARGRDSASLREQLADVERQMEQVAGVGNDEDNAIVNLSPNSRSRAARNAGRRRFASMDRDLSRYTDLRKRRDALASDITRAEARERRAEREAAPSVEAIDLTDAAAVKDKRDGQWHQVLRVNANTVTVAAQFAGLDNPKIPHDRIMEVRKADTDEVDRAVQRYEEMHGTAGLRDRLDQLRAKKRRSVTENKLITAMEARLGKAPAGDEPGDLTNRVESANVPAVTSDQVRAASDDELATLLGAHAEDDQVVDMVLGEMDRRQRDAEITTAISEDAQWARLDELMAAGWNEEEAVEEALGIPVEEQRRERAITMLRNQGYTGARFEELARKSYRDYVAGAYRAAEDATRGHLLTREGQNAGIDPGQLFSGPEVRARRWASDELKQWWDENERQTFEDHKARLLGGQAAHRGAEGAFLT